MHVLKLWSLIGLPLLFSTFFAQVYGIHLGNWSDVTPAPIDFWGDAIQLGDSVQKYAIELIQNATASNATVAIKLHEFKDTMSELLSSARALRETVQAAGINPQEVSERLSVELLAVLDDLQREFQSPDNATHHEERVVMISWALAKIEDSLVNVLSFAVPEADIRAHFQVIEQHAKVFLVLTGDLAEQHPVLLRSLLFYGAIWCLPEMWLLRPFLRFFGFGPSGPVKGSIAAWAQRRFWGSAVAEGSWFAHLQSVAMRFRPLKWWEKLIPGIADIF